jgi:hypothetical protein
MRFRRCSKSRSCYDNCFRTFLLLLTDAGQFLLARFIVVRASVSGSDHISPSNPSATITAGFFLGRTPFRDASQLELTENAEFRIRVTIEQQSPRSRSSGSDRRRSEGSSLTSPSSLGEVHCITFLISTARIRLPCPQGTNLRSAQRRDLDEGSKEELFEYVGEIIMSCLLVNYRICASVLKFYELFQVRLGSSARDLQGRGDFRSRSQILQIMIVNTGADWPEPAPRLMRKQSPGNETARAASRIWLICV